MRKPLRATRGTTALAVLVAACGILPCSSCTYMLWRGGAESGRTSQPIEITEVRESGVNEKGILYLRVACRPEGGGLYKIDLAQARDWLSLGEGDRAEVRPWARADLVVPRPYLPAAPSVRETLVGACGVISGRVRGADPAALPAWPEGYRGILIETDPESTLVWVADAAVPGRFLLAQLEPSYASGRHPVVGQVLATPFAVALDVVLLPVYLIVLPLGLLGM